MHTNFHKGTPLFIKMKDGRTLFGKFKDHKSGKVFLEDGSYVDLEDVRAMSIRKLETSVAQKESSRKIIFRSKN